MLAAHGPHDVSVLLSDIAHVFFLHRRRPASIDGFRALAKEDGKEGVGAETHGSATKNNEEDDEARCQHRG